MKFCECGCRGLVKVGYRGRLNRFVQGHNLGSHYAKNRSEHSETQRRIKIGKGMVGNKHGLGHKHTNEWKQNKSEEMKNNKHALGSKHTEEWKLENGKRMEGNQHALGMKHTEEWKEENSKRHTGNTYSVGRVQSEESNIKRSETLKGRPSPMRGRTQTEEAKVEIGKASKGNQYRLGHKDSEETIQNKRKAQKKLWDDPVWRDEQQSRMARGNRLQRPNKTEIKFLSLLDYLCPGDWKYVGDGSLMIDGKNPDFVNVNGKKQIIELYGDYWHKGQDPQDRIDIFTPFGYKTLVIWERELKDISMVTERIQEFVK